MFDRVQAQEVMRKLMENRSGLTTSKIRKLLSMVNDIYNDVSMADAWDSKMQSKMDYFIIRMAYESGRDRDVNNFIKQAELMEKAEKVKGKQQFMDFNKYLEALTAYHRFYGGRD